MQSLAGCIAVLHLMWPKVTKLQLVLLCMVNVLMLMASLLVQQVLFWYRVPAACKSFLNDERYRPLFGCDVWALGLVMLLEVVGGQKPERQNELLRTKEYLDKLDQDDLGASDPGDAPGMYRHLKYLSNSLADPNCPDYCDQVCCLLNGIC